MSDWAVTNLRNPSIVKKGSTIEVKVEPNDVINSDESIYWIAPSAYRGNKVSGSFNTWLKFISERGFWANQVKLVQTTLQLWIHNPQQIWRASSALITYPNCWFEVLHLIFYVEFSRVISFLVTALFKTYIPVFKLLWSSNRTIFLLWRMQITAYGGKLIYTVRFQLPRGGASAGVVHSDVRIEVCIIFVCLKICLPGASNRRWSFEATWNTD